MPGAYRDKLEKFACGIEVVQSFEGLGLGLVRLGLVNLIIPEPLTTAPKAIILHTFGAQVDGLGIASRVPRASRFDL